MSSRPSAPQCFGAAVLFACLLAPGAAAADFPEVTSAERQLQRVASDPGAHAVVLFEKADFTLMDLRVQRQSSALRVMRRIKVFDAQGVAEHGEVRIRHGRNLRLSNLEGRTVTPDGRVLPVPGDAETEVERERDGRRIRVWLTDLPAIPAEPGSVPTIDLAAKFMLIPESRGTGLQKVWMLDSWDTFVEQIDEGLYRPALAEGQAALPVHRRKPEVFVLPESGYDANGRLARVALTLGEDGRLTGKGSLTYTGHRAWQSLRPGDDPAEVEEGWVEYLLTVRRRFDVQRAYHPPGDPYRDLRDLHEILEAHDARAVFLVRE